MFSCKICAWLRVGIHDHRSSLFYIFYRSYTPIPVYPHPPAPMHPLSKTLSSLISSKYHNKHPLVDPLSTSQNAPSHVRPFLRRVCALSTVFFDFDSHGRLATSSWPGPNPMSPARISTRSVGGTHISRMISGLGSAELQMQPSHVRCQVKRRSAVASSPSVSEDFVRVYLFSYSLVQWRMVADGPCSGAMSTSLTTNSTF